MITRQSITPDTAVHLIQEATNLGVTIRLLGGLAVYTRCVSAGKDPFARKYGDIDLIGKKPERKKIEKFLMGWGFEPNKSFNTLNGHERLMFIEPDTGRHVDVLLGTFRMCHELDFSKRIETDQHTLPLADLLLSKLQIIELNVKDLQDLAVLLYDHPVSQDNSGIDASYLANLLKQDWGLWKTVTDNLASLTVRLQNIVMPSHVISEIVPKIQRLNEIVDQAPKTLSWRMRSIVGERVKWYELPES